MIRTCLCVALNHDFFYLLQTYAEKIGFRAINTNRGQDIMPLAKQEQPAVILLEADNPKDPSPWDVLKTLKSAQALRDIPVILFSWLNEEERALAEGADVYVQKPVMYVDFLDALVEAGVHLKTQDAQTERR